MNYASLRSSKHPLSVSVPLSDSGDKAVAGFAGLWLRPNRSTRSRYRGAFAAPRIAVASARHSAPDRATGLLTTMQGIVCCLAGSAVASLRPVCPRPDGRSLALLRAVLAGLPSPFRLPLRRGRCGSPALPPCVRGLPLYSLRSRVERFAPPNQKECTGRSVFTSDLFPMYARAPLSLFSALLS